MFKDPLFPVEDRFCREADAGNDDLAGFLFTDALTSLQNRRSFRYHIERFREQADRKKDCFSILYIDVDHFRSLNEKFGVGAAESTLIKVAGLLSREFSNCGVVFRYAGDEFRVILPGISETDAVIKAKHFQDKVGSFFETAGTLSVSVSIVAAMYPNNSSSIPSMLQSLDRALKICKTQGTNQILSASSLQSALHEPEQIRERIRYASLIGRTKEWNRLHEIFEQCQKENTHFVFLTGEAGIGKTHLLQRFLLEKRKGNCFVFSNVIDGLKHHPNEVLRSALKLGIDENSFVSFKDLCAGIQNDEAFCRSVETLIRAATVVKPMVLALDDVQSHDAQILSLLQYLSRECRDLRLMLIAVIRKDFEMSPILNWFIQSMTHADLFEEIHLDAMSSEDCGVFVSNIFQQIPVSQSSLDWVFKETMGNPFYVEELIHLAVEEGLLTVSNGAIVLTKTERILIPDSVRYPLLQRIKGLNEVHQHILGLASAVGYEFEFRFVSELLSQTMNYREEMIEELIQLQFFRKSDQGILGFFSPRVRDLIYEEMGKFNRRMFHECIAEELEKQNQKDPKKWPVLAYHYARTGNLAKAIHYLSVSEQPILKVVRREAQ